MKFNDVLNDGLCQEINRICGSTNTSYPFKAKAARINVALDHYFSLASIVNKRWRLDDTNQSLPPIDTQNIVSGTNRYKISAFAQDILNFLKLEVIDNSDVAQNLILENFNNLPETFDKLYINADSGMPSYYTKYGDFIYLRPKPDYNKTSGLKIYLDRPSTKYDFTRFTVTIASPGVFTADGHGLVLNDEVIFETDSALPTGLTSDTTYYVISAGLTTSAFEVSTTQGGPVVNTSGSQTGNHSFLKTNKEPGIPSIHHNYLCRLASLPYLVEKNESSADSISRLIAQDEMNIIKYLSNRDSDDNNIMSFKQRSFE